MRSTFVAEKASQCSFRDCERSSDATLSHQKLCREHLLAICRNRLDAAAGLLTGKPLLPGNIEVARNFVIECANAAKELRQSANDLAPLDQANLMDILLRVEDISQRLLRHQS